MTEILGEDRSDDVLAFASAGAYNPKMLGSSLSLVLILLGKVKEIKTSAFGVCTLLGSFLEEALQAA
jgi:hypothetical protein